MRILILLAGMLLAAACGGGGGGEAGTVQPPTGFIVIGEIQGSGAISPLEGRRVTISGTVTGDFQNGDADEQRNLGGFYVLGSPDGNAATSDGIFVFDGDNPSVDVSVGDTVEVDGRVIEYFGETQLEASAVRRTGTGTVNALALALPASASVENSDGRLVADLERYEGMLVEFTDTLAVTELRNLARFGEVTLSQGGRLFQYTNGNSPSIAGYNAHLDLNARRSIVLDDGLRTQNPDVIHYLDAGAASGYSIRLGDTLQGLTGNLRYSRGAGGDGAETWRVMPTMDPAFVSRNPRPATPAPRGSIRVGAFNLLNFFTTLDAGSNTCGPQNDPCRGADTRTEYERQLAKTTTALVLSGADVLGLTELENNASASLRALVDAMNARTGGDNYAYINTGVIHDDVIKAGLIYRRSAVSPVGRFALLDHRVDSRFNDDRNRPALAQAFEVVGTGARFSIVVNHLKSKGSSCEADGDPNLGDGQGNCNLTRTSAAAALTEWVGTDPTGSGDTDYLVIGDMNAYYLEDPIETMRNGGLVDLLDGVKTPYSYHFDAQSGAYDYAFATPSLAAQVSGTIEWHINIDEPPVYDYNLEFGRDPALFDSRTPYRASDHDPVLIGLDPVN